jgi:hypothetical protein
LFALVVAVVVDQVVALAMVQMVELHHLEA